MHKAQHQDILFCEESKEKLQKHGKASKVRKSKESYTKFPRSVGPDSLFGEKDER